MKFLKILALSVGVILLVSLSACSIGQAASTEGQTSVSKGNLTVIVNGTGKTAYGTDAKLGFGATGKIEKLNIQKGDAVSQNKVLAQLDTDSLELALLQARVSQGAAKAALDQAQLAQTQTKMAVAQAENNLLQAKSAKTQAEASVTLAQFNLDRIKAVGEIKDKIMDTQIAISTARENRKLAAASGDSDTLSYLNQHMVELSYELDRQNIDLLKLLAKDEYANVAPYETMVYDPLTQTFDMDGQKYSRLIVEDIQMKEKQVEIGQQGVLQADQNIKQAEQDIEKVKQNVEQTVHSVEQAQLAVEQAGKAVSVAQKQLDSSTILAPFDGVIASLEVKQDDFVVAPGLSAGTPIYMVDPKSLEVRTEIDELDIANIQVGQSAVITLEAMPGQKIEGKVTSISLLPILKQMNSGVVVYEVKVSFAGTPPDWAKTGMSAGVDIVTNEKNGILLVPNKAIKQNSQGQKIVNLKDGEKTREQLIVTGLSNGVETEVISGINEGDVVVNKP